MADGTLPHSFSVTASPQGLNEPAAAVLFAKRMGLGKNDAVVVRTALPKKTC